MKNKLAFLFLVAIPAMAATPADADITGTWAVSGDVSGVSVTETCALKQGTDGKLSGTCNTSTGKYEAAGTFADGTATFHHGGTYDGNSLTITYTGKLGSDGAMTGTLYVDSYDATGSFTAKKTATVAAQSSAD